MTIKPIVTALLLSLASVVFAGHPGEKPGMSHPPVDVPEQDALPRIQGRLVADPMDGYNLLLQVDHFVIEAPAADAPEDSRRDNGERWLHGHLHLYVNGEKIRRLYGAAVHIPGSLLKPGVNSISVGVNSHGHNPYRWQGKDIQLALTIDTRRENPLLNHYRWPD